ncbi:hypothetical protein EBN03_16740 [Nocardia stercoris]|uniref:Uncharacterized protein n=1 Tax=Nocardia stercoris TaxID=2483361 RepID=A0A3M2L7U0_9NOCA|nr:hypothetical protein EBN03_16740 [Nocardia stercoris]
MVSVAAGGGGMPIRPVQVEGTFTPPAYLLADAKGGLHTAGLDRRRPDLGLAVSDVRDILGHQQIVIAGATWPAELVFRARLYNPLAAIGAHLKARPEVVALPFPDDWPDEKVDEYARLVETLGVAAEPIPESVALSGYLRALGLVRPSTGGRKAPGITGVYSDGRECLVVAVDADDERPTESVGVPITSDALRDSRTADNTVIEVMAAARSIGADTSSVLLTGNVCFNDALRLAFQNHLGSRLRVADHPMHALVLGAAHLLVTESEAAQPTPPGRPAPQPGWGAQGPHGGSAAPQGGQLGGAAAPGSSPAGIPMQPGTSANRPPTGPVPRPPGATPPGAQARRAAPDDTGSGEIRRPQEAPAARPRLTQPSADDFGATTRVSRSPENSGPIGTGSSGAEQAGGGWNKARNSLFGASMLAGAVAAATVGLHGSAGPATAAQPQVTTHAPVADVVLPADARDGCAPQPAPPVKRARTAADDCATHGTENLHYRMPIVPAAADPGPPLHI